MKSGDEGGGMKSWKFTLFPCGDETGANTSVSCFFILISGYRDTPRVTSIILKIITFSANEIV